MRKKHVALALAAAMAVTTLGGQLYTLLKNMVRPAKQLRHGRITMHVSLRSEQRQIWLSVKL